VAALGGVASDPSGSVRTAGAGVAVPVADYATLAIRASMDQADGVMPGGGEVPRVRIGTVDASIASGEGRLVSAALTASGSYTDQGAGSDADARLGGGFDLRVGQGRKLQLQSSGDLDMPWREAASTIREGGRETGVTAHLYALPLGPNLIFDVGTRLRSMELAPQMDVEATGSQKMVFGGADWVAWSRPAQFARGQILDENLRWTAYMADSLTIGYRRFEAFTRDDFGGRLVLADRDSIDQVSAIARKMVAEGSIGAEARTTAGIDWARDIRLWSAGFSLLITPIERARASITYDYAKESTAGFVGVRHTAWASIHVDL
jgi:hypothetical protein